MRYLFGFLCVCALGVVPLVGCTDDDGAGGGGGGMPECQNSEDCDDGESCTISNCVGGACEHTPRAEGSPCEGDDAWDDACSEGVCASGVCERELFADGTACDDNNQCRAGVCASGVCDRTPFEDGTACGNDAGTCQQGSCRVACDEQGILDAIAAGGGTYTFDCDGPQTVMTDATIEIDNNVILDGEGNLTVDGNEDHRVFFVQGGVDAELGGLTVTRGRASSAEDDAGGGILNNGSLALVDCSVRGNTALGAGGIGNVEATLTLTNTTVSGNTAENEGGGIGHSGGVVMLINSTVSGNSGSQGGGIWSDNGDAALMHSTVSGNSADSGSAIWTSSRLSSTSSLIDGDCDGDGGFTSNGYNIESPGNTCDFDQEGDQVNVTEAQLNLGELANNGGPTMTHKPGDGDFGDGSVAIDKIPAVDCRIDNDQREEPRPETGGTMCDVGAVEVQP